VARGAAAERHLFVRCGPVRWGRIYFAVQAIAGAAWWVAVAALPVVRFATLGTLDPVVVAAVDIPLFVIGSALAAAGLRVASLISAGWTCLVALGLAVYATVMTLAGWGVLVMAGAAGASILAAALIWLGRVPTGWLIRGPFAVRPARMRPGSGTNVASTLLQMLVFWGVFLVVVPLAISWLERRWDLALTFALAVRVVGVSLLVLASGLGVASAITMSARGHGTPLPSAMPNLLVITGPYRWVRNPMAVAGIVQGIGVGLILSSWLVLVYAVVGSVLWNYAIRPHEESDLRARFGEQFEVYRTSVRCWIPTIPPV
jgi:protein-S-isoprenylcysteine O-methyltransferase Ste14